MTVITNKVWLLVVVVAQTCGLGDRSDQFLHSIETTKIVASPGRHVCTTESVISRPVPVVQTYKKPVYTPRPRDCPNLANCPQYDVQYVPANRTVYQLQRYAKFEHRCCPGWTKAQKRNKGCMGPICTNGCGEFGLCVKPDECQCRMGFAGDMCDTDIDECKGRDHGCTQICKNTAGSYMCACQEGFVLASDGRTCNFCFQCQKEYTSMMSMMTKLQNELNVQVDKEVLHKNMTNELKELQKEVVILRSKNENAEEMHTNATSVYLELRGQVESLTREHVRVYLELRGQVDSLTREHVEKETLQTNMTNELKELQQEVVILRSKNEKAEEMHTNATSGYLELRGHVESLTRENEEAVEMHTNATSVYLELRAQVESLTRETQELKMEIAGLERNQSILVEDVQVLKMAPPPPRSSPKPTTTTAKSTTRITTPTTTPPTTTQTTTSTTPLETTSQPPFEIEFNPIDMIMSLSNQIGQMEEKLDLCSCFDRRP